MFASFGANDVLAIYGIISIMEKIAGRQMIDYRELEAWLWARQLECIPDGKEKHWLDHSTSALMAYQNVLDYLKEHEND